MLYLRTKAYNVEEEGDSPMLPQHPAPHFDLWLREQREKLDLNQTEFAEVIQVSETTISRWERNLSKPTRANLKFIIQNLRAQIPDLDVPPAWIEQWLSKTSPEASRTISAQPETLSVETQRLTHLLPDASTGEANMAALANRSELVEASSASIRSSPSSRFSRPWNAWRHKWWVWVALAVFTVLIVLVVVGSRIIAPLWPSNSSSNMAIGACATAPTLTAPFDGQTLDSRTVTFTWEAPQGCIPNGYTVRINPDRDPEAKPWIEDTGWAPTDYTYVLPTDGTYYWHIRDCKPCTPFQPGKWETRIFTIHT
jgi:transcriptional regulator with XRE-family HTH domain